MERALSLTALMKRIGRALVPITVLGLGIVMALPQSAYAALCPANDSKFANCSSCNITPGTGTVDEFGNAIPPQYYCSVTNSDGSRTDVVGGSDIGNSSTTRDPNGQITEQSHTPGTNALIAEPLGNGILATVLSPIAVVSFLILSLASFLLWLAGVLFNWAVAYLVFDFGTWFGNSPGLLLAWRILRDFGNIILLYGFVYMGIATILDLHDYTVKKALPNLVIFAVLLNFSLFISQLVIDTSNVFASTLYNQTYSEACDSGTREECLQNTGIASQIVQQAGIGSVFGNTQQNGFVRAANLMGDYVSNPIATTISFFGLALLVTTAAVVLFAGALLLIARAIHLGFLMVTSPIGFAGMAVPPLQKIASDWWGQLINQALFAPVFLLLLFAALKITEGLQALKNDTRGNLGDAIANGGAGDTGAIMLFALVIGFMIAALLMAKRFGVYGADAITKNALGVIQGTAGAASFGAMGWATRRTIGGASNVAARAIRLSPLKNIPFVGSGLAAVADAGAKASFDGRSILGMKDLGEVSKAAKEGARGESEATKKRHEEYRKTLTEADEEKFKRAKIEKERLEVKKEGIEDKAAATAGVSSAIAQATGGDSSRYDSDYARRMAKASKLDGAIYEQKGIMGSTTTGKIEEEKEKKEKLDETVTEWKATNSRLETVSNTLERIGQNIATEQNKRRNGDPSFDAVRLQELIDRRTALTTEKATLEPYRDELEGAVPKLGEEIRKLRLQIKKEERAYRLNLQGVAAPNVAGLSVVDRGALQQAAVAMTKNETAMKPKKLADALGKALQDRLKTRGMYDQTTWEKKT